jgi:MFS family permease
LDKTKIKKLLGHEHKECYRMQGSDKVGFKEILKIDHIPFILMLYFAIFLGFNFFYVAFPVHAVQSLNWSLFKLGIFFSVLGLVMVLVQGPILSKISTKFSDAVLATTGSILLAISFLLFTINNDLVVFLSILFFSGGNGIMWPSFLAILSRAAGSEHQGAVQGYASSSGSLASIIGLIAGGIVYGFLGAGTFFIPALLLVAIFALSFKLIKIEKTFPATA